MAKQDNRENDRAKRRIMVKYGVEKLDKRGFTKNVSDTGLFVRTNTVFVPDTTLQLEIAFPERTFGMWGRVIWAKKVPPQLAHILDCGMGICFIDPDPEYLAFYEQIRPKH